MKRKILFSPLIIIIAIIVLGVGVAAGASLLISGSGGTEEVNLQKGLVGHWDFNGNAKDSTPNANDGTVTGTTLTTDRKGAVNKAYSFNGANNDYIDAGNGASLRITGPITVEAWVKATTLTSGDRIVERAQWSTRRGYYLAATSATAVKFTVHYNDAAYVSPTYTLPIGQWVHLVGIYDGSMVRIYANGVEQGTGVAGPSSIDDTATTKKLFIGSNNGSDSYWNGLIDDVRIYNRALSQTEITALYNEYDPSVQVSDLQRGLVGQWKMDGNAKDSTPNANDGTVTGASPTTDRKGQMNKAYSFNGTSDYIDAGSGASLQFGTNKSWSFETWVNVTGSGGNYDDNIVGSGGHGYTKGCSLFGGVGTTPNVYFYPRLECQSGVSGEGFAVTQAVSILNSGWVHLVGVFDRQTAGSEKLYLYKNGILVASNTTPPAWLNGFDLTSGYNFYIGRHRSYTTKYFHGLIDDVRIYNRALSQAEITALYESY
jgi:hypothetical protein